MSVAYSHPGTPEAHDARDARWRQLVERLSQVELSAEQADRGGRRRRRRFRFVSRSGQGSAWSVWSGLVRSELDSVTAQNVAGDVIAALPFSNELRPKLWTIQRPIHQNHLLLWTTGLC